MIRHVARGAAVVSHVQQRQQQQQQLSQHQHQDESKPLAAAVLVSDFGT